MARFYGTMTNSRGNYVDASGGSSGQYAHIRGWAAGVAVESHPDPENPDKDCFAVYMTTGSGGHGGRTLLGYIREGGEREMPVWEGLEPSAHWA